MMELTFLKLGLLWGAVGVAAPVIIHLVMRQKPRLVPFPALRFVRASHLASLHRHRLKHLLLLLMRCLLLLLLALALARPVLKSDLFTGNLSTPVRAVFLFDDSYSMTYEFHGKTRLEEAQALALEILEALPPESEFTILTTSAPGADTTLSPSDARKGILGLQSADAPSVCYAGLERACDLLAKAPGEKRREVFLFTDMTAVGWRDLDKARPKTDKDVGLYVIDVGVSENRNVALTRLALSRQVLGENTPLGLTATVTAGHLAGQRVLELYVDGGEKKDLRELALDSGQVAQVTFEPVFRTPGLHQGKVAIKERDAILADNEAYFSVLVRPAPKVLLVSDAGGSGGPADDVRFVSLALSAPRLRLEHRERVQSEVIDPARLAERRLSDYAAVLLINVARLADEAWTRLKAYVSEGGGVAILAGDRLDLTDYAREGFAPHGSAGRSPGDGEISAGGSRTPPAHPYGPKGAQSLLPGTLGAPVSPPDGVSLTVRDFQHPILAVFADGANGDLGAPLFARYVPLTQLKSNVRVVIPFSDGAPALTEHDLGRGRVLFFASSVGRDWADFPLYPAYLVFIHRLVDRLGGALADQYNFEVGQVVRLGLAPEERGAPLRGLTPGRSDPVPLLADETGQTVVFPQARAAGHYQIEIEKGLAHPRIGFSLNRCTEESRLERITREAVAGYFPPGAIQFASSREELQQAFTRLRVGKEILPYVLLCLLMLFVVESYLANRFYRREGFAPHGPAEVGKGSSFTTETQRTQRGQESK